MKELQEILKYTKDLVEKEPEKSAFWHYNKLVSKIEEAIDVIHCCKSDSELLNHGLKIGDDAYIVSKKLVEILDIHRDGKIVQVKDGLETYLVDGDELEKVV